MEVNLTRDAQKLVAAAYKEFLEKRKSGVDKANAKFFSVNELHAKYFGDFSIRDYKETVAEMSRALKCTMYMDGGFMLSDYAIVYMENRFKNGVIDTLSFLAQFIP